MVDKVRCAKMNFILPFVSLVLVLISMAKNVSNKNPLESRAIGILPEGVRIVKMPSKRHIVQIEPKLGMNYEDSREACETIGGTLADLFDDEDLKILANGITSPHWIKSFNGRTYDPQYPPALFSGPAIAHPRGLTQSLQGVFCQIY